MHRTRARLLSAGPTSPTGIGGSLAQLVIVAVRAGCLKCRAIGAAIAALAIALPGGAQVSGPPTFGVRGTVLDESRRPVAGAEVRLVLEHVAGAVLADTTRTDALGRFATRGWIVSSSDGTAAGASRRAPRLCVQRARRTVRRIRRVRRRPVSC